MLTVVAHARLVSVVPSSQLVYASVMRAGIALVAPLMFAIVWVLAKLRILRADSPPWAGTLIVWISLVLMLWALSRLLAT
jgi:hypothetical protein